MESNINRMFGIGEQKNILPGNHRGFHERNSWRMQIHTKTIETKGEFTISTLKLSTRIPFRPIWAQNYRKLIVIGSK